MTATRPDLSPNAAQVLTTLESTEILGASRQLKIAADLFVALTNEYDGASNGLICSLRQAANYLIAMRGGSSQAVPNAIHLMLEGLEEETHLPLEDLRKRVTQHVLEYDEAARQWMKSLTFIGASLVARSDRILAYDYSSSVSGILRVVHEGGHALTVVVPEARSLDGGRKYLADLRDLELHFEFIPDAAMSSMIRDCDLVIVGAETLSAQGGCYNTIGTLTAAIAAEYWRVPFYVASTLIKIDAATLRGRLRTIPDRDVNSMIEEWNLSVPPTIRAVYPDLDYTPPNLITGVITELGILPPAALWQHAKQFPDAGDGG